MAVGRQHQRWIWGTREHRALGDPLAKGPPAPPLPRVLFSEERAEMLSAPTQKWTLPHPMCRNGLSPWTGAMQGHSRSLETLQIQEGSVCWGEVSPKSCPGTQQPLGAAPGAPFVAVAPWSLPGLQLWHPTMSCHHLTCPSSPSLAPPSQHTLVTGDSR